MYLNVSSTVSAFVTLNTTPVNTQVSRQYVFLWQTHILGEYCIKTPFKILSLNISLTMFTLTHQCYCYCTSKAKSYKLITIFFIIFRTPLHALFFFNVKDKLLLGTVFSELLFLQVKVIFYSLKYVLTSSFDAFFKDILNSQ